MATVVAGLVVGGPHEGLAQPTPAPEPTKAAAIKLPDGTVVFWTKNPDEANPAVDGVVLTPQEYKALVEQAELAKKAKPQAPSSVAIRGKIEPRGERLVAALTLTYSFRTTQPRTLLILGCQRSVLVAAKTGQGKLPILNPPGDDGLTLLADAAGEQTLTLDIEIPIAARGIKNEIGFDIGLPRAAITTLTLDAGPATGIKSVALGTRIPEVASLLPVRPTEAKRFSVSVEQLVAKPIPLGATDLLEFMWEPLIPTSPSAAVLPTVDSELIVKVEESQIETVAKLKLRGALKEWPLQLPAGSDVTVERAPAPGVAPTAQPEPMPPTVLRPTDANKPVWVIRTPGENPDAEWLVTATHRVPRPKPGDPKFRGPYLIGPYALGVNAKQSGRINVFAGPTVRLSFKPLPEFRRLDLPAAAADDHIAQFAFAALAQLPPNGRAGAWFEIDARIAPTAIRAKSSHQLKLTPGGWRLETTVRIVPPPRGELEQVAVEIPEGWSALEASPEELVESIHIVKDGSPRLWGIRFHTAQKSAFTVKLLATFPLPIQSGSPEDRESKLALALPRFPQADERETILAATVPDGFELRGNAALWEGGQPSAASDPLTPPTGGANRAAITAVGGTFDRAVARVELSWQTHRPALTVENRVDVSLQPRQLFIQQVLKFKPSQDDRRTILLRGPEQLLGLQSVPALDPVGPGRWEFRPNVEPGKEFTLTVAFALRLANPEADPAVLLLWPESATRIDSVLRLWGGGTGRRVEKYAGDWRELPSEPAPDRDALPLLTLGASGEGAPLTLDLSSLGDSGLPTVWIERAYIRATVAESGQMLQTKLLLKRWLGSSLEVELPRVESLEVWIEGRPVEAIPQSAVADSTEPWLLSVPLPESKPNKPLVVELRYRTASAKTNYRERLCAPPKIRGAVYRTPVRWLLATDSDRMAFIASGRWDPEFRWARRGFGFAPTAAESPQELDAWLTAGTETESGEPYPWLRTGGDAIAGRQSDPQPVPVMLIPKSAWIAGWSTAVFAIGWALSRLRKRRLGVALASTGVGLALAGALAPQGLAQMLSATPLGAAALALTLVAGFARRFYRLRSVERLPGFSRERQRPMSLRTTEIPAADPESGQRPSRSPAATAQPRSGAGSIAPPGSMGG